MKRIAFLVLTAFIAVGLSGCFFPDNGPHGPGHKKDRGHSKHDCNRR